ncbi:MAG: hypothetical protein K6G62_00765 [Eubacterium sp.]|nr:hypothetical protein [Eubacterium sp.]
MNIEKSNFTYKKNCKGQVFDGRKITNNSSYVVLYNGSLVGEVATLKEARSFIDNLVRHQRLKYTAEY